MKFVGTRFGDGIHGTARETRLAYVEGGDIDLYLFNGFHLSLIHISEPTRQAEISYAVFCLKKKKKKKTNECYTYEINENKILSSTLSLYNWLG